MAKSPGEEIREALAAGRRQADAIIAAADEDARRLSEEAELTDRALAAARLARLAALRDGIAHDKWVIDAGYAGVVEAMALATARLAELSRRDSFEPPAWRTSLDEMVEVKLSETRELTFRLQRAAAPPPRDPHGT